MKRFIAVTISLYLVACISLCCIFAAGPQDKINNTEANDIIFTVRKYWPDAERAVSMMQGYGTDYLVTDAEGRTVAASGSGLNTDYVYDFIHKDYSVDILEDGKVLGRIIFINNGEDDFKRKVGVWALAFLAIFLLKDILAVFYLRKHIFDPVKRMNDFAGQWGKVRNIFTVPGLIRLGTSIVGKWFYLAAGSGLVICWGMRNLIVNAFWICVDCFKRAVSALLGKKDDGLKRLGGDSALHLWFFGVFLAWVGTFMICAIYKEGLYKVDDLVHGRYIEYTIGILLIYSIDILLAEKHWLIMLGICTALYSAAGVYCQYVYDELQRTHYELAHAVMFGRVFWNYQSPTGKIQQLTGYILPLSALFYIAFKLFGSFIERIPDQPRINSAIATARCILALMVPLVAWTHLSDAIIDNYVCSRNSKQSGALPNVAAWANTISRNSEVYFINDSLSYKQASLLQYMLMDREVRLVPMSEISFDSDDLYIINNAYLGDPVIMEKCDTVISIGSYALVINNSQELMNTWNIYKEVLRE